MNAFSNSLTTGIPEYSDATALPKKAEMVAGGVILFAFVRYII